jgi:hypothetical protein
MAYSITKKEGKLKDIISKIAKNKEAIQTGDMSTQEMKDVVGERLRQDMTGPQSIRQVRNNRVQDVTITPGSPGEAGYTPEGTGTSMKDIKRTSGYKSQRSYEFKQRGKADRSNKMKESVSKVGEGLKYGAVELGNIALDKMPFSGMTTGKRRYFVGPESGSQDRVFGSDEKGHHRRYLAGGAKTTHYPRMTNKEWRKTKKANYTVGERARNLVDQTGMKTLGAAFVGLAGVALDNSGFGMGKGKTPGQGQRFIKEIAKKGVRKIKGLL